VSERRGFTLTEVVLAVALLAVIAFAVLTASSSGVRTAARAGEMQLATVLAQRFVDRVQTAGYPALAARAGQESAVDLSFLGEPGDSPSAVPGGLAIDGTTFTARFGVASVRPGLIKIQVGLSWQRPTGPPGEIKVFRYIADPLRTLGGP
jgi:prepilin-type N-terminal cleavage/methylation domain-containing protein